MILAAGAIAAALTACAKSEDADIKVLRNDVDLATPQTNTAAPADPIDAEAGPMVEQGIAAAIRAHAEENGGLDANAKWRIARRDLNGDGTEEALVYLMDLGGCGSGGCSLYVLARQADGWTITDEIGPSQLPVYQLDAGPDGWSALGVSIRGGGARSAVMSVPHDTQGYADNPTVAPAKSIEAGERTPIIADGEGTPLPTP